MDTPYGVPVTRSAEVAAAFVTAYKSPHAGAGSRCIQRPIPMSTIPLIEQLQARETLASARLSSRIWVGIAAGLAFGCAYFQLFIFPAVPVAPWGDPVLFLENAKRILAGQLPYRDYLQFTTPGTELFYAALIRLSHARAWIPSLTMVILAALVALMITLIASRLFPGVGSLAPALLFVGFVLPNSLYATHHWFSTVAVLLAAFVLIKQTTMQRVLIVGLLCGVAGFFTQTKLIGAILTMALFLFIESAQSGFWREFWTRCSALCLSAATMFLLANLYFIRAAGLGRFVFCTIVFPLRYYPAEPYNTWRVYGVGFTSHPGVARLLGICFVHAVVPLTYLAWFLYRRKHPALSETARRIELMMALVGIGMFLAIASSPSLLRLCTVSPPALILAGCILQERPARYVLRALTGAALALALAILILTQTRWHAVLNTPSGRIAFFNPDRLEEFYWVLARTTPRQSFFGNPHLSFAMELQNPTPVNFSTTSDFTRPSEVAAIVRGLDQSHAPLLILLPTEYAPQSNKSRSDAMEPFRSYLHAHYQLERRFATGDEAWVRFRQDNPSH